MYKLILVRHGQSEWNLENKFTGWYDSKLTQKGIEEARYAGELIKALNVNFEYAFTSFQQRAIDTLTEINKKLNNSIFNIVKAWELNERHYGALQGLNKEEIKKKHGEEQVKLWRRSYDIAPPPMDRKNPNHAIHQKIYQDINPDLIPNSESLKDTLKRVIPYYENKILPVLKKNKNLIISAHGNSLRSLCKKIFNISDQSIVKLEIPTGNPIFINFDEEIKLTEYKYLDQKRAQEITINQ